MIQVKSNVGPQSLTESMNNLDSFSEDSTLTRSFSSSSSSIQKCPEVNIYDDCPYDTGMVNHG